MNFITRITVPKEASDLIKAYIRDFENSKRKQKMKYGEDYYRSRNTEIMNRKMLIYAETEDGIPYEVEDPYKANNKLPSGYFKLLVDQKLNYLLGKEIAFDTDQEEELKEMLGRKLQSQLKQLGKEASKKVIGWKHPYIDEEQNLKFMIVPSEQIIPVYKPDFKDQLELIIRYYRVTVLNEDGEAVKVTRVEVWDDEEVAYYQENDKTGIIELITPEYMQRIFGKVYQNPKYHFQKDIKYGDKVAESEGIPWNKVPFIPLYNNDDEEYDLQPIKPFIDAYDIINSDFINNLEDFQDVYWILKGYDGENLQEFLHQVKRYKTLKVADDGDARSEQIEIPYEARREALKGLENDIFNFGMGVNPSQLGEGGTITNVVIKSRYTNLDLKCNEFETQLKDFIHELMHFVNRYRELTNQSEIELKDVQFTRSMIMNENEILESNAKQQGRVSEETRLANHLWVDDVEEEKERMRQEQEEMVDLQAEPLEGEEE